MAIDEILTFKLYYRDQRFVSKIPDFNRKEVVFRCGDNIYEPLANGEFRQLRSMHSNKNGPDEAPETKTRDLSGLNVLISWNFHYFGRQGPELPNHLGELIVGRAHKNKFSPEIISKFHQFIAIQSKGISGPPTRWPDNDQSWRPGRS
jgi:hypothetical protein